MVAGEKGNKLVFERRAVSALILTLLLTSTLTVAFGVQPVKSDYAWTETIYIRADGSIQPSTAPISSVDNVTYTLTDNIAGDLPYGSSAIIIQKDSIIIDGADHTLQGTQASNSTGIELTGRSNVTIKNMEITAFRFGIWLNCSSNNAISGNNITYSSDGIDLVNSSGNIISGNNIADNWAGIWFEPSSNNNSMSGNNITNNEYGIYLYSSSNNTIFHNNFVNNNAQVYSSASHLYRSLVAYVPKAEASLSSGTLADAMGTIINAHDWSSASGEADANVPHYATVFSVGSPSLYQSTADAAVSSSNDRVKIEILRIKRAAEIDGIPSAVSDSSLQNYLSSAPMVGYLPNDYSGYYLIYERNAAHAYSWAADKTKWNSQGALTQVNNIVQVGAPGSPKTYIGYSETGGVATYYRYYDDTAETLEWFLEAGGTSYLSTCDMIWNFQQSYFWNGQYYGYNGKSGMETEVGPFALISGRYLVTKGILSTYQDRIVSDLNQKLLINGYSSPLWNHYSLNHVPGYDERRLENAAAAWAAMEAYYPVMTQTMQDTLQGMGAVGWRGLLDESGDFDASANMFRYHSNFGDSMMATGIGLMVLFMNGITPVTGSLAIPLNDEQYEDTVGWSPATMFRFDYAHRQIRIPVNAGTLNFIFGTGTATYTFPSTGVYQVQFSSDWNTVQSASRIEALDSGFKYIAASSPPPTTGTLSVSATYNGEAVAAQVQVTGPTSTTVTTPTTITVEAGDYSLLGTYQTYSLTRTCTVPANGQATVSFPFTSSRSANTWDDGYPSGGNYWSDYQSSDFYCGPYQNMTGSDGLGDTPYVIDANNTDHYPLTNPYGSPPSPTYNLTIIATIGGTTNPAPGTYTYTDGTGASVTAMPNVGYKPDYWILDGSPAGSANPIDVLMTQNHTLEAVFAQITYQLTIETTSGGTTTPAPGTYNYAAGYSALICAVPNANYALDHWELNGLNAGSANPYTVTMTQNYNLKAVFAYSPPPPSLSVSITPLSASTSTGQSLTFNSAVTGGAFSYSFQWYLDGNAVSGATSISWVFTPTTSGNYSVYLNVTDSLGSTAKSNEASVAVVPQLTDSISPTSASVLIGQPVAFTSTVSGGYAPYSYQWYLNDSAVSGATSSNWTFTLQPIGDYNVYLNVTDSLGNTARSNQASVTVAPQLAISISPMSESINMGDSVNFTSTVSGGYPPYSYQWYLNNNPVPSATSATWTFTPSSEGAYHVYVQVMDSQQPTDNVAQSETANVTASNPSPAVNVGGGRPAYVC